MTESDLKTVIQMNVEYRQQSERLSWLDRIEERLHQGKYRSQGAMNAWSLVWWKREEILMLYGRPSARVPVGILSAP